MIEMRGNIDASERGVNLIGIKPAKLSARVGAHLIDLAILLAIYSPLLLFTHSINQLGILGFSFLLSFMLMALILYFTFLEGYYSTTPGKKLFGLFIISLDNMRGISYTEAFIRNLMRLSDIATIYLASLINKENRRIGDIVANTLIVSKGILRLEVPLGSFEIAKDVRRGIIDALIEKLGRMDISSLNSIKSRSTLYTKLLNEIGEAAGEVNHAAALLLSNPKISSEFFSPNDVIEIYDKASQLCYYVESRSILKQRSKLMKAVLSVKKNSLKLSNFSQTFSQAPMEFREILPYFGTSLTLFFASLAGAYLWRPKWLEILLRELFGKRIIPPSISPWILSTVIFMNNFRVILATVGTAPLLFMPFLVLVANGALVGLVISISKMGSYKALGFILPHGVPELTAIFIASSIALMLIKELISPSQPDRASSIGKALKEKINLMIFSTILLIYAALIEGFITEGLGSSTLNAILFSLIEVIVLYLYLLLGFHRYKS